jgi:hypothetical protein
MPKKLLNEMKPAEIERLGDGIGAWIENRLPPQTVFVVLISSITGKPAYHVTNLPKANFIVALRTMADDLEGRVDESASNQQPGGCEAVQLREPELPASLVGGVDASVAGCAADGPTS